jgi:hypothetical protein
MWNPFKRKPSAEQVKAFRRGQVVSGKVGQEYAEQQAARRRARKAHAAIRAARKR